MAARSEALIDPRRYINFPADIYLAGELADAVGHTGAWAYLASLVEAAEARQLGVIDPLPLLAQARVDLSMVDRLVESGLWHASAHGCVECVQPGPDSIVVHDLAGDGIRSRMPSHARPAIPQAVRAAVFARDGRACLICIATEDLTLDHIYPWSLGGPDTVENLRVLCRRCNSSKGARV